MKVPFISLTLKARYELIDCVPMTRMNCVATAGCLYDSSCSSPEMHGGAASSQ